GVSVNGAAAVKASHSGIEVVGVSALAGDDTIRVDAPLLGLKLYAEGGAGNDRFDAARADTACTLVGGAGNDTFAGGSSGDAMRGDDGDDRFTFSFLTGQNADSYEGGNGTDRLVIQGDQNPQNLNDRFVIRGGVLSVNDAAVTIRARS